MHVRSDHLNPQISSLCPKSCHVRAVEMLSGWIEISVVLFINLPVFYIYFDLLIHQGRLEVSNTFILPLDQIIIRIMIISGAVDQRVWLESSSSSFTWQFLSSIFHLKEQIVEILLCRRDDSVIQAPDEWKSESFASRCLALSRCLSDEFFLLQH